MTPWRIGITGSPATGKKSVAKMLAKDLGLPSITLNELAHKAACVIDEDVKADELVIDIKRLRRALSGLLPKCGYVVSGVYLAEAVPAHLLDRVFVLRCDPRVLLTRYQARDYDERKIKDNLTSEFLDYCLVESLKSFGEKVHEVDTTGKSVAEVVQRLRRLIEGKWRPLSGSVDWLGLIGGPDELAKWLV